MNAALANKIYQERGFTLMPMNNYKEMELFNDHKQELWGPFNVRESNDVAIYLNVMKYTDGKMTIQFLFVDLDDGSFLNSGVTEFDDKLLWVDPS